MPERGAKLGAKSPVQPLSGFLSLTKSTPSLLLQSQNSTEFLHNQHFLYDVALKETDPRAVDKHLGSACWKCRPRAQGCQRAHLIKRSTACQGSAAALLVEASTGEDTEVCKGLPSPTCHQAISETQTPGAGCSLRSFTTAGGQEPGAHRGSQLDPHAWEGQSGHTPCPPLLPCPPFTSVPQLPIHTCWRMPGPLPCRVNSNSSFGPTPGHPSLHAFLFPPCSSGP